MGRHTKSHPGCRRNVQHQSIPQKTYDVMGGQGRHQQDMGRMQHVLQEFHSQDSKRNYGPLAHSVHENHQSREAHKAEGNIISMAGGRSRFDLLHQSG